MPRFDELDFEANSQQLFERFLVAKPELPIEGLYRLGREFFIVAPSATKSTQEGRELLAWFDRSFKPAAHPLSLVSERPEDSLHVALRKPRDVARCYGATRTWHDIDRDLALALPIAFPLVGVRKDKLTAVIEVARDLTDEEAKILESTYTATGTVLPYRVEIAREKEVPEPTQRRRKDSRKHNLEILSARHLPAATPSRVRHLVEQDDDCWREIGLRHFAGEPLEKDPLAEGWAPPGSCLIDTTFPQSNLRSFLTLYPSVIIVAPLADSLDERLRSFGVSRKEFVELTRTRSVRWLLPQSIDRYDPCWLEEIAEAAPDSCILSRRLSVIAARDQARRNPLYSLAADAYEKRGVIRTLHRFADHLESKFVIPGFFWLSENRQSALILRALAVALKDHWEVAEQMVQVRGAMSSISGPLARHAVEVVKAQYNRDLFMELGATAQLVEWSGAFGAHLIPTESDGFSTVSHANLLVALSSGAAKRGIQVRRPRELVLAEQLLAFDNDTNVVEFANEIGNGDLARVRKILGGLSRLDDETAQDAIELWNSQIRSYERKPDRLKGFNIAGIVLAAASRASPNQTVREVVPILATLVPGLMTYLDQELVSDSVAAGKIVDWANGTLAGAAPDAVLISRMRKRLAGMRGR